MALYVSTEELKQVSKNLADKKNQISFKIKKYNGRK